MFNAYPNMYLPNRRPVGPDRHGPDRHPVRGRQRVPHAAMSGLRDEVAPAGAQSSPNVPGSAAINPLGLSHPLMAGVHPTSGAPLSAVGSAGPWLPVDAMHAAQAGILAFTNSPGGPGAPGTVFPTFPSRFYYHPYQLAQSAIAGAGAPFDPQGLTGLAVHPPAQSLGTGYLSLLDSHAIPGHHMQVPGGMGVGVGHGAAAVPQAQSNMGAPRQHRPIAPLSMASATSDWYGNAVTTANSVHGLAMNGGLGHHIGVIDGRALSQSTGTVLVDGSQRSVSLADGSGRLPTTAELGMNMRVGDSNGLHADHMRQQAAAMAANAAVWKPASMSGGDSGNSAKPVSMTTRKVASKSTNDRVPTFSELRKVDVSGGGEAAGEGPQHVPYFRKGSIIQLSDDVMKVVEDLTTADFFKCAESSADLRLDSSCVEKLVINKEKGTILVTFLVGESQIEEEVEATLGHPFFVYDQGWSSACPEVSATYYELQCKRLQKGDRCVTLRKA